MTIIINQTLHGYREGHQMIASSVDIPTDAKKILLFQSDLSGSSVVNGFEEYITGYPLDNTPYFVLSKSWYAYEMTRPGCVWTHSLLIEKVDLGRIPELGALLAHFFRPILNKYERYERELKIELDYFTKYQRLDNTTLYDTIAISLYNHPDKKVVVVDIECQKYENVLVNLWSDQWPRLRRNFTFTSGALSLRSIYNRVFDLQIVPQKLVRSIIRDQDYETIILANEIDISVDSNWLKIFKTAPKNLLRQFMWSFGSDMHEGRQNYTRLLYLYDWINNPKLSISQLSGRLKTLFPNPDDGKSFKNSIYGIGKPLNRFSEYEILTYLSEEKDLGFLNLKNLNFEERLLDLISSENINQENLLQLYLNNGGNEFRTSVIDKISVSPRSILSIITNHNELIPDFLIRNPDLLENDFFWESNYDLQIQLITSLYNLKPKNISSKVINAILKSKSKIILEVVNKYGHSIVSHSLNWSNINNEQFIKSYNQLIANFYTNTLCIWLQQNESKEVKYHIILIIFEFIKPSKIYKLHFTFGNWIKFYDVLKHEDCDIAFISSIILSKGLSNSINNSEWIVANLFTDVYKLASQGHLNKYWEMIPKDLDELEDDDMFFLKPFFSILGLGLNHKRKRPNNHDLCDLLSITYGNKFVKNWWNPRAFIIGLNKEKVFLQVISHLDSTRKGRSYLSKVKSDIKNKKYPIMEFHKVLYNY